MGLRERVILFAKVTDFFWKLAKIQIAVHAQPIVKNSLGLNLRFREPNEVTDVPVSCQRVLHRPFQVDLITIAAAIFGDNYVAMSREVVDDPLNGSLGYAYL
jgi:hypothetical protein